jgi:DNA invertase Pin-like site-specific DNA recombinase
MDTTTPHGELLFAIFGALAQYERALTRERVMAGLAAARRRGRTGGRPPALDAETIEQVTAALEGGASKASVCRAFQVPRSTLLDTLARVGWTGPMALPVEKAVTASARKPAAQRRSQTAGRRPSAAKLA